MLEYIIGSAGFISTSFRKFKTWSNMPGLKIGDFYYTTMYHGENHLLVRLTETSIEEIGELKQE